MRARLSIEAVAIGTMIAALAAGGAGVHAEVPSTDKRLCQTAVCRRSRQAGKIRYLLRSPVRRRASRPASAAEGERHEAPDHARRSRRMKSSTTRSGSGWRSATGPETSTPAATAVTSKRPCLPTTRRSSVARSIATGTASARSLPGTANRPRSGSTPSASGATTSPMRMDFRSAGVRTTACSDSTAQASSSAGRW
jgi:hypothetical protein